MNKFFIIISIVLTFEFCWSALPAGSVSMATGGSGRGTREPVDSVLLNPAAVGILPTKFMTVTYSQKNWGLVIADNGRDAIFPAAVIYRKAEDDLIEAQQIGLALNYTYKKVLSIGGTVSSFHYEPKDKVFADSKERQTVLDLGLMWAPTKDLSFGLVGNNLASQNQTEQEYLVKSAGVGAQYTFENFLRFRFDIESNANFKTDRMIYMGGLESFVNDWFLVRMGYQNNNVLSKNFTTLGLGFAGPQFGLHYGLKMDPNNRKEDIHAFDLGVPF